MKPFKTYRQQLAILRSRGLSIPDGSKAMRVLETDHYYSLINGYKDMFLQVDNSGIPISPERYIKGATFDEIHKLYSFDRDLRNTLIKYLLNFESSLKSKIAYRFTEEHKESHAYLVMKNYTRDPKKLKDVLRTISTISQIISNNGNKKNSIGHHIDKHGGVPLWVLVSYLTLGNMNYFYLCLEDSLRNKIAKDFAVSYNRDYEASEQITADMLEDVIKTATFFRNKCAHVERLYNFSLNKPARNSVISKCINIDNKYLDKGNLFTIISFLKLVIPKKDHKRLIREVTHLIDEYSHSITSVSFSNVLDIMGFPTKWEGYF